MRVKNKLLLSILTAVMCTLCLSVSAFAFVDSSDTHKINFSLSFDSDKASCIVEITGAEGTDSISDCTVTLADSDGSVVNSWSGLSSNSGTLRITKSTLGVVKGHTYTLSVTATVHRNGNAETVTDSFTLKYN